MTRLRCGGESSAQGIVVEQWRAVGTVASRLALEGIQRNPAGAPSAPVHITPPHSMVRHEQLKGRTTRVIRATDFRAGSWLGGCSIAPSSRLHQPVADRSSDRGLWRPPSPMRVSPAYTPEHRVAARYGSSTNCLSRFGPELTLCSKTCTHLVAISSCSRVGERGELNKQRLGAVGEDLEPRQAMMGDTCATRATR